MSCTQKIYVVVQSISLHLYPGKYSTHIKQEMGVVYFVLVVGSFSLHAQSELRTSHQGLNIYWMADRTSCFLEQGGSRDSLRDAWAQCLAGLLEPHLLPEVCPTSVHIAWPYAYHRMCKAYAILDPG